MKVRPKGKQAAALRKRKHELLASLRVPPEALPGSLSLTHRRCGKPTCHCAQGKGHPVWTLTYMDKGKKRVERIPDEWVEWVRARVDEGRRFKEESAEVFTANARLLALWRKERKM